MSRPKTLRVEEKLLDLWLVGAVSLLLVWGIIMVYSASAFYADRAFGDHMHFLKRHLMWLFVGISVMGIAYRLPLDRLAQFSRPLLGMAFLLLVYLAFVHRGRWLHLGPVNLQGVDLAKFALIVYFADSLARREADLPSFSRGLLPHLMVLAVMGFLVWRQPDFSSAAMLVLIGGVMLLVSPVRLQHLLGTGLVMALLAATAVLSLPYQRARLMAFLHPDGDPQGKLYQIYQSLIALGSGGIGGVGFAQGHQKQFFLPEAHTDFIFAIIGEEWGLVGTVLILSLFFVIMIRGLSIARKASGRFEFYLTAGITAHLVLYALVNMMVNLGLLPPTGLPLPFISYGGSAMVFSCVYVGLLLNLNRVASSRVLANHRQFARQAVSRAYLRKQRAWG
ncbi:MAG: putative lipid II flippase FtsW [Calditrichaeota bacterium]|nr:MAG: putative lipid II flippase FtsW [Calditrichota bacterium]